MNKIRFQAIFCLALVAPAAMAASLDRLQFNNPGLVVDLAAGLWAWPLPMDFDGDGDLDMVVSCPDKPYNGVYVFENPGGNQFPIFRPGRRIGAGLQNVQVSHIDGVPRVLSPGQEYPEFLRTGLAGPQALPLPSNVHSNKVRGNFWRYVDFDGDGKLDIMVGSDDGTDYGWENAYDSAGRWTNGPLRGFIYLLRNNGATAAPAYEKAQKLTAGNRPIETFGWPSPSFADFDGDGDLDLICGEFLDSFTYFQNVGSRTRPQYAPGVRLKHDGQVVSMDLEMITPVALDWDHDGDIDLVVGDEDGRVALIENTGKLTGGIPDFLPPRYFLQEADEVKFGALATPVGFDWDGDGDLDIICGNTAGYIGFIENLSGPGVEVPRWAAPKRLEAGGKILRIMAGPNGSIQGPCEAKWGYTTQTVADWDGDGLPDLVVNSIWGKVHWYRNVGTRTQPRLSHAKPIEVEWDTPQPALQWGWLRPEGKALLTQWRTTPIAVDWNRDGLTDLIMLDQEGYLVFFERRRRDGRLELLPPQRLFYDENEAPLRLNAGVAGKSGRRKLCVTDWDGDGRLDVLANGANAIWYRQIETRAGKVILQNMGNVANKNIEGHDTSPTPVDWNNDGIPDLLIGAEDGHLYYLKNPRTARR